MFASCLALVRAHIHHKTLYPACMCKYIISFLLFIDPFSSPRCDKIFDNLRLLNEHVFNALWQAMIWWKKQPLFDGEKTSHQRPPPLFWRLINDHANALNAWCWKAESNEAKRGEKINPLEFFDAGYKYEPAWCCSCRSAVIICSF